MKFKWKRQKASDTRLTNGGRMREGCTVQGEGRCLRVSLIARLNTLQTISATSYICQPSHQSYHTSPITLVISYQSHHTSHITQGTHSSAVFSCLHSCPTHTSIHPDIFMFFLSYRATNYTCLLQALCILFTHLKYTRKGALSALIKQHLQKLALSPTKTKIIVVLFQ